MPDSNSNQPKLSERPFRLKWIYTWPNVIQTRQNIIVFVQFQSRDFEKKIIRFWFLFMACRAIIPSTKRFLLIFHLQFRCGFEPWIYSVALIHKFTFIVWPLRIFSYIPRAFSFFVNLFSSPFFILPMTSKRKNKMFKSELNERLLSISDCILRAKMCCFFSSLIRFPLWVMMTMEQMLEATKIATKNDRLAVDINSCSISQHYSFMRI